MPSTHTWDIFCTVVDNYGDIGVCWRLARQLAAELGIKVRLWVDDLESFRRICPDIVPRRESQLSHGVEVRWWREPFPAVTPADVVVEAFACNPPASYVRAMAAKEPKPAWINLEFLSAEDWVRGCHGLPSPQPALGITKYFFFPGFVSGTGGLLAEPGLMHARDQFQHSVAEQAHFWERLGLGLPRAGEAQISLFCYENPAIAGLLRAWSDGGTPMRCLVPAGVATQAISAFFGTEYLAAGTVLRKSSLEVKVFSFMGQYDYDRLLWACDFNLVRGEDSFVRAQWAARPFLWHIYPQNDQAHWVKLQAFLGLYCRDLPRDIVEVVRTLWEVWNQDDGAQVEPRWTGFWRYRAELQAHAGQWAAQIAKNGDLANNLAKFCGNLLKYRALDT